MQSCGRLAVSSLDFAFAIFLLQAFREKRGPVPSGLDLRFRVWVGRLGCEAWNFPAPAVNVKWVTMTTT